jgi:Tfp pilus assembly protein FimT
MKSAGFSLVEVLAVGAIAFSALLVAMPVAQGLYASVRIHSAGQQAAMTFRLARAVAIRSGRETAVRIEIDPGGYRLGIYRDGNGNGVRTAEITKGVRSARTRRPWLGPRRRPDLDPPHRPGP